MYRKCFSVKICFSFLANNNVSITLTDILIFATGADRVPPLGFPVKPKISFLHGDQSIYPKANTCGLELKLPVVHKNYEEFTEALSFGIGNCNSFGFA